MLNGLEFVSYLIEAPRDPPDDCTFLVSEIEPGKSNHHGLPSFHSAVENGYKTLSKVLYECGSNANRAATTSTSGVILFNSPCDLSRVTSA